MAKNIKILAFSLVVVLFLSNCSNDDDNLNQIEFGIWISTDKTDTLDFKTQNNFYKSNAFMQNDNYDYKLLPKDSIQIGYRGKLFILVEPTNHKNSIEKNELTIDFTNQSCYGFDDEIMTYIKE
jgi:hypothetical protein